MNTRFNQNVKIKIQKRLFKEILSNHINLNSHKVNKAKLMTQTKFQIHSQRNDTMTPNWILTPPPLTKKKEKEQLGS